MITILNRLMGLLIASMLLSGCSHYFFQPMQQHIATPEQYGIDYKDIYFGEPRGPQLHGWWFPATSEAHACVLFLHGNAENISTHAGLAWWLTQYGYEVFIFDYRGYGRSGGEVDVAGAIADIQTAKQQAREQCATEQKLFVLAHSLGASLGIVSLAQNSENVDGAIFVAAFAEYPKMAREMVSHHWLGWLLQWPVSLTISSSYDPLDYVSMLRLPSVFAFSDEDEVIAAEHVLSLYRRATGEKYLERLGGGHNRIFSYQDNQQRILFYLDRWSRDLSR